MQILKEEVRNNILTAAEDLFYKKGFKETTTRAIAEKSAISVSNLYKYFKNKEGVFSAVVLGYQQQLLQEFTDLFSNRHHKHNELIIEQVTRHLFNLLMKNRKKFIILMQKSQGTEFANFKDSIINLFIRHMQDEADSLKLDDTFTLEVIATNLFEGIIQIIGIDKPSKKFYITNITSLLKYHLQGMQQFK